MKACLVRLSCALVLLSAADAAQEMLPSRAPLLASGSFRIEPLKLEFDPRPVGTSSPPMITTVTNGGSGLVRVDDIFASGIDFTQTNSCGDSLAPGSSCQIQVIFKPATTGTRIGVLSVMVSSPGSPYYVVLTGVGQ
jgi:hypothetical protein